MSDETRRLGEPSVTSDAVLEYLEAYYHVPVLAALLSFMLWVRLQSFERFVEGSRVLFSGNDAWYHLRQVRYSVENWPAVMPFDPWTYFPYGTSVGQFGTLYDQLVATAAVVVGLGDPSARTVALTLLVAPAVFSTLVAVPTYLIGRRLGGRVGGLFGVLVLALLPGVFLSRGLVGMSDHNVAEPLFQSVGVLGTMVALRVAVREKPVWEQVLDRDVAGLRATVGWSALAGVAISLYVWTWPPAVLLIGILGIFYVLWLSADYVNGESPEHVAFVAAVSMAVVAVLSLVPFSAARFSATQFSFLQPMLALAVGAGAVVMAWLGRRWDDWDLEPSLYPVSVGAAVVVGALGTWLLTPSLYNLLRSNLVRFVGFDVGAGQRTIGEAMPLLARSDLFPALFSLYGLAFFTALAGALIMLANAVLYRERNPEYLLVLVWFTFITAAAFTQSRFNYYLVVPVAVMNAYLLGWTLSLESLGVLESARDVNANHVFVAASILLIVAAPLAAGASAGGGSIRPAVDTGNSTGPYNVQGWVGTLEWMEDRTPREGTYAGADNADELPYYGTYERTEDYPYPEGAYGVMSWWDYGHWITTIGERIPNANPFQQGADTAANYLLAPNETDAEAILDEVDEDDAKTRYVAVDYQMVTPGSKFSAPTVFYDRYDGVNSTDYRMLYYRATGQGQGYRPAFWLKTQNYYKSQMVRLYRYHGSRVEPEGNTTVVTWRSRQYVSGMNEDVLFGPADPSATTKTFSNYSAAEAYVAEDPTHRQIGGQAGSPPATVEALDHYRLVKASQRAAPFQISSREGFFGSGQIPSYVKLFERVPGATVRGTAPADTTVTVEIPMRSPSLPGFFGNTFTYEQQVETGPDGTFEMTVPYATSEYDALGPAEGYTNASVRATGPATFTTPGEGVGQNATDYYAGTAEIPEPAVVGATDEPVTVDLSLTADESTGDGSDDGTGSGDGTGDDDGTGDGNATGSLSPLAVRAG